METEWCVARVQLRELLKDKPRASDRELAEALGYSPAWAHKWRKRIAQADPNDDAVLHCQSHRPKTIARQVSEAMEERIVQMRQTLSAEYNRKVGPRTIAAYLRKDPPEGEGSVPTSTACGGYLLILPSWRELSGCKLWNFPGKTESKKRL